MHFRDPTVSVGVPVYNGAASLRATLDALLQQTYADFEIIVSDNASTDGTAPICAEYATRDNRVRYIRQPENIGPERNFKFVIDAARGRYFMWSACDDVRSHDFLEENVRFLEANPGFVASTSPNCFEGQESNPQAHINFAIEGDIAQRFDAFFDNCWVSHGIFYSLMRTDVLKGFDGLGRAFYGFDWAVDLYLASRGMIHRTQKGLMASSAKGLSNQATPWRRYRAPIVGWLLPFGHVSAYALKLSKGFSWRQRLSLIKRLAVLNFVTARAQLRCEASLFYHQRIRPWLASAERT